MEELALLVWLVKTHGLAAGVLFLGLYFGIRECSPLLVRGARRLARRWRSSTRTSSDGSEE